MPNPKPVGNRTSHRGRKLRRDIRLDDDARTKLRRIWRARTMQEPGLTEDEIVNALILQAPEPEPIEEWQEDIL